MAPSNVRQGVWFPQWAEVLARFQSSVSKRRAYQRAIGEYLRFCKQSRQRATLESARQFMQQVEAKRRLGVSELAIWKEGLNWFFREAGPLRSPVVEPAGGGSHGGLQMKVPPLAATDLGGPEWERRLIQELRTRHYQWRTEQTYRMWAERFARWLEDTRPGRNPIQAEEGVIRDYLSELATRQRVSASTQRQALNALVFDWVES